MALPREDSSMGKILGALCSIVAMGTLLFAGLSHGAGPEEECPTWFPDFRCEREGRYEGFIMPMSAPYLFEDPFITTGVQAVGIWHDFPGNSVFKGGYSRVYALQVRVALTDRLGFVASKDGYATFYTDQPLFGTTNGYFDLIAGFKYALIDDEKANFILTPSLRYQATQGSRDVLAGNGDGIWIPAVSAGWGVGDFRFIGDLGAQLPVDGDRNSTPLFYNLHVAYPVTSRLTPFVEMNGLHYLDEGDGSSTIKLKAASLPISAVQTVVGTGPFEGLDILNLGSDGVDGNDIISLAVGARYAIANNLSFGFSYEHPVTRRKDILQQRFTISLVFEL